MAHRARERRLAPLTPVRVILVSVAFLAGIAFFWPVVDCVDQQCYMLVQTLLPFETPRWDTVEMGYHVEGGLPVLAGGTLAWAVSKATGAIERRVRGWDENV